MAQLHSRRLLEVRGDAEAIGGSSAALLPQREGRRSGQAQLLAEIVLH